MRKDPSDVTRELKLALIVGFALVLTVAILVSDHLSKARTANLATVAGTQKVVARVPDSPIRSLEELLPAQLPAAVEVSAPVAAASETPVHEAEPTPQSTGQFAGPVVIGQQQVPTSREMKIASGPQDSTGSLSASIREHAQAPTTTLGTSTFVPPSATPQDIVAKEVKKAETKPAPLAGEKSYKIAEGDTLYAICRKQYGDAHLYKKLASANKLSESSGLKVGTTIILPSKESLTGKADSAKPESKVAVKSPPNKPETRAAKVEESKNKSYQVRPGDTLSNIARKELGSASRSSEIASLNRMDPDDDLLAGAILKMPSR